MQKIINWAIFSLSNKQTMARELVAKEYGCNVAAKQYLEYF